MTLPPLSGGRLLRRTLRPWAVATYVLAMAAAGVPVPSSATDRAELEQVVAEHYDDAFLNRAAAYHRVRLVLFFLQIAVVVGASVWLVRGPLGSWGRTASTLSGGHAWVARLLLLSAVFAGFAILRLPFSVVRFLHARQYDLRHDSWTSFLLDWIKGFGIGWIMVAVVGVLVLGLFAAMPRGWWAVGTGVMGILTVGYVMFAPLVIDPLFNRFQRLDDPDLETRLVDLAGRGGVNAESVWVADASRRSRAVNAYFTGFGKTQRIVLYDTLVEKFDPDEVAMVLAHEVGHWKHRHIYKGLALGILATLVGLLIAHAFLGWAARTEFHGLGGRGDPGLAIPAYALYILLMLASMVPSNWVSRRMETEADRASLALTSDPETFIRTETRLARENLSNVLPPAWIEFALYSHPCNARRILMAERYK